MIRFLSACACVTLLLSSNVVAAAGTDMISYTDSIAAQSTNWSDALEVSQFDPALGTLCEVKITLEGDVAGSANYESLDAAPADITLDLAATINLQRPDTSSLVSVLPLVSTTEPAGVFDGTIDFAGVSGNMLSGLSDSAMDMVVLTDPADLVLFTGLGTISMPTSALGSSTASGAGNLITQFSTEAGAGVTVTYTYNAVPEPATVALLAIGLVGVIAARRNS